MSNCADSYWAYPKVAGAQERVTDAPVVEAPTTVVDILRSQMELNPDGEACRYRNAEGKWIPVSWKEHVGDIVRVSAALTESGIARGDRLAVMAHTCREWQVVEMAGLLAGAVIVGVDAHAVSSQVEHVMLHSGAVGLIHDGDACLKKVSSNLRAGLKLMREMRELCAGRTAKETKGRPVNLASCSPEDPATIIYTSGTTGLPKGIEYTHRQLMVACESSMDAFPALGRKDSSICWLPMSNLLQRIMNLVAMRLGMTLSFVEDPRKVVELAREVNPTVFVGVPRFFEKLHEGIQQKLTTYSGWKARLFRTALAVGDEYARRLRAGRRPGWRLTFKHAVLDRLVLRHIRGLLGSRIRCLMSGSAPIPVWLLEFYHACGLAILEGYGISENTVLLTANRVDAYRFGSAGFPLSANEISISSEGEVLVRGAGLFRGYVGNANEDGMFTADGFYRTGDCGHFGDDGFLYLTGRRSDILKTSTGRKIAPVRVESVYRRSRYVDQVVVAGQGRKYLTALVIPRFEMLHSDTRFAGRSREELAACPELHALIRQDFESLESDLSDHERVVDFAVLARPFSLEAGELTGTLKVRRDQILAGHAQDIDRLYNTKGA
ncbi:MAG: hypothetical protein C0404_07065 [Verrucomicrobia bacterium]|nr:hypothetical protein [Verrucomicrobiota bacterium]